MNILLVFNYFSYVMFILNLSVRLINVLIFVTQVIIRKGKVEFSGVGKENASRAKPEGKKVFFQSTFNRRCVKPAADEEHKKCIRIW